MRRGTCHCAASRCCRLRAQVRRRGRAGGGEARWRSEAIGSSASALAPTGGRALDPRVFVTQLAAGAVRARRAGGASCAPPPGARTDDDCGLAPGEEELHSVNDAEDLRQAGRVVGHVHTAARRKLDDRVAEEAVVDAVAALTRQIHEGGRGAGGAVTARAHPAAQRSLVDAVLAEVAGAAAGPPAHDEPVGDDRHVQLTVALAARPARAPGRAPASLGRRGRAHRAATRRREDSTWVRNSAPRPQRAVKLRASTVATCAH